MGSVVSFQNLRGFIQCSVPYKLSSEWHVVDVFGSPALYQFTSEKDTVLEGH